jgi:hypothetical protein
VVATGQTAMSAAGIHVFHHHRAMATQFQVRIAGRGKNLRRADRAGGVCGGTDELEIAA